MDEPRILVCGKDLKGNEKKAPEGDLLEGATQYLIPSPVVTQSECVRHPLRSFLKTRKLTAPLFQTADWRRPAIFPASYLKGQRK